MLLNCWLSIKLEILGLSEMKCLHSRLGMGVMEIGLRSLSERGLGTLGIA